MVFRSACLSWRLPACGRSANMSVTVYSSNRIISASAWTASYALVCQKMMCLKRGNYPQRVLLHMLSKQAVSKSGVTCCRRQRELPLHNQPTCPDLFDVLREVPTLLAMVSPSDWPAILGSSKQLRHVIHSAIQAITVILEEDVTLVLKGSWPQLSLIKLEQTFEDNCCPNIEAVRPASCNFHLIASIHATLEDGQDTSAFIVRPLSKQLQLDHHIAAAFLNLQSAG